MRRSPVPGLVMAVLAGLALTPSTALGQSAAPATGTSGPAPPAAAGARPPEPRERTVARQLDALLDAGLLTREARDRDRARYTAARAAALRLRGTRAVELRGVVRTVEAVARRGELTSSRVALAFETLERNRQWWTSRPLLGYGARVGFPGSELVWQHYAGQGIQVQWLATWGRANALFHGRTYDPRLRALIDEALPLAASRAGGIAFEYFFTFDGGRAPWVSGLAQGTALQALSRAAIRLGDRGLFERARAALGIFRIAPPEGIRVPTAAGAHYLQYSFSPRLRILNGFVQALNGLHDFGALANDSEGRALFTAGEAELRLELPRADTGAWSRYSVGGRESDLGYHRLLRDVLRGLCERTGEALSCDTAARFTADLTRAPRLRLLPPDAPARKGHSARVAFTLDKVSSVQLVVTRGRTTVFARTATFARGTHAFALPRLRTAGTLGLRLRAVDPAGNVGATAGTLVVVRAAPRTCGCAP